MYHVLTKIDTCSTAHDVIKSVTILDAIRWVALAWEKVSPETIQKCFRKAGILSTNLEVVSRFIENEEHPFADLEDHNEGTNLDEDPDAVKLQYLMDQLQTEDPCSVEEFIQADTEQPTCQDIYRDNWEEDFLNQVAGPSSKAQCLELVLVKKMKRKKRMRSVSQN